MNRVQNKVPEGLIRIFLVAGLLLSGTVIFAQTEKKFIRKGNRDYDKEKYQESEVNYRKASDKNKQSSDAVFNIGDALYRQQKYEDAGKQFEENARLSTESQKKAAGLYNLGNSLFQANKLKESIEAYKNSLKIDPENKAAKYNLGYAQNLLKKQEQQQQQQQQQKQDQKQDQNKDQNKQDKNQDKNQNNQQDKDQQQQQQKQQQDKEQQGGISKEDAQRLLDALANDEKNVQEKVKRDKAARARVRSVRNW
jgi:tetratricopeptide (TPR) repeat protein